MAFGGMPVTIAKDGDRTYTLRCDNSDEAVAITRLSRTALTDIKKTDQRVFEGGEEP